MMATNLVEEAIRQPQDDSELQTRSTSEIHIELQRANATKGLQSGSTEPTRAFLWTLIWLRLRSQG